MIATFVRKLEDPWRGDAGLYKVEPEFKFLDFFGDFDYTEFLIVSSLTLDIDEGEREMAAFFNLPDAPPNGTEQVAVFPSDAEGEPLGQEVIELTDTLDVMMALGNLGYTLVVPAA